MLKLQGKTALITGGSSGIGLAIARRFAAEGAKVFITGRRQAQLDTALAEIGGDAEAVPGDVTSTADLDRLFATLAERAGQLDILVTSSGVADYAPLDEITEDHIDCIFDLNVRAMVLTVQRATRQMTAGGTIVLVGSIAGTVANPGYATYSASKAAVRSYARTWTHELAARGIRVNTLSPGPTDTPMFDGVSDALRETLTSRIPFRRLGRPEEIASAALFLASDDSSFVGGADLHVDGGMVA
ncbi:NAD(P)-dependent dehydrogenase (short-subunit alcohol dehydrogenase family) [Duganella sp. 1224]|uniref:SDR family NAD(P)-dependent oxidoreductase n=1 Tax=Duganella sp. 1224 TaxID=2587052 RepID=UPI0015CA789B|nr:glucose 1-dehydrogenase [Duganella sp. 1224]NYE64144.1 NAD(P)-dependent dehydrogenase (short-subunit alcohol dehydrogenase family) [Duganella sp. 1224]